MRRLQWLGVALAALTASTVALGALPKTVSVSGKVRAVSTSSIRVAGTACALAPTHPRMMMPTIIRDVDVGDTAVMTCTRLAGRLVLAKLLEKPAGAVIVSGTVSAKTATSVTVRGVTCLVPPNRKPVLGVPTIIKGVALGENVLIACTQLGGQLRLMGLSSR